jgi:YgiT-type zinc finger domain-containing protein
MRGKAKTACGACAFCGGEVEEDRIEYDYRRKGQLLLISNVPAGVCRQCGAKYFKAEVLKKMDEACHEIFDLHRKPERVLAVPTASF